MSISKIMADCGRGDECFMSFVFRDDRNLTDWYCKTCKKRWLETKTPGIPAKYELELLCGNG